MIIHQRVLHFQIESPEECQRNAVIFANQLLAWLPCSRLACLYILCRKDKSFLYFYGEKMIPEYDLEASGTNACISSLCFLCMLSHSPSCRFLSMPRLVWNKPIYLGRRGSRCEGLWKSHPGLPSELSCSPGSSSSMFISSVPNLPWRIYGIHKSIRTFHTPSKALSMFP